MIHTQSDDTLNESPIFPECEGAPLRKLDYLGYAPCPVRHEMQRRMHTFFQRNEAEFGKLEWFSPSGCGAANDPYDLIWKTANADEMPSVISDGGSSDFFRKEGHERWIKSGVYGRLKLDGVSMRPEYIAAGAEDPMGALTMYAAFPSVFMVDMQKLGNRPVPKSWAELGDPIYKNDVTISGWEDEVPDPIIFNLWKNYGQKGIENFARNIKNFWAPAQMAKTAGSSSTEGTAIYVLSLFFALGNPRDDKVRIVWPEEGAWFSPLTVLAKPERKPVSRLPIDFLTSTDWAQFLDKVGAPSAFTYPGQKPLPGKLGWMGWDFIRGNDLDALRPKLNGIFLNARKG